MSASNACRKCFKGEGPVPAIDQREERGDCSFCDATAASSLVWDVSVFREAFLSLFENYRLSIAGVPIENAIESDWEVFSFGSTTARRFLSDILGDHPFLAHGALVSHIEDPTGGFVETWDEYVEFLTAKNRYFPPRGMDTSSLSPLGEVITQNQRTIRSGTPLFRGRLSPGRERFLSSNMGMPPRELSRGGRCNPTGIPHLYLAFGPGTCVAECRPGVGEYVSVGTFIVESAIKTLDLHILDVVNPFVTTTSDSLNNYLQARAILMRLRQQMAAPARASDIQAEYIPTQFLCEYAKHLGLQGVIYPSTLDPDGVNVVLFDADRVNCSDSNVGLYRVESSSVSITPIGV